MAENGSGIKEWVRSHQRRGNIWGMAASVGAAVAVVLSILTLIWSGGGAVADFRARMEQNEKDIAALKADKEDRSEARAERQGELDEINTLKVQQQEIIQLLLGSKKQ